MIWLLQDKKSKVEHELIAHQQKMRAGGLALSQGTRRILQERERHARKAGQAAAAITASAMLDQVRHHLQDYNIRHHLRDCNSSRGNVCVRDIIVVLACLTGLPASDALQHSGSGQAPPAGL